VLYFDIYVLAIVDEGFQLVMLDDAVGQHVQWDAHVGIILGFHGCSKVEILQVAHHPPGCWC